MQTSKKAIAFLAVLTIIILGAGAASAYAFYGQGKIHGLRPGFSSEKKQERQAALDNGDYAAWKNLMGDSKITEFINEDNFSRYAEMEKLMKEGRYDDAQKIREELGLPNKSKVGMGNGFGRMGFGDPAQREEMKQAIQNRDYAAWRNLVGDSSPLSQVINQDNFEKYAQMESLRWEGNFQEARKIAEELGLQRW